MTDNELIKTLLESSPNGTITTEQVTSAGLHRSILQELVNNGEIYRLGVVCIYAATHGKTIFTYCSSNMGVGFIHTIQHCICLVIPTEPRRNTL